MHERRYLHRDIKPENILVGLGLNSSTIYLIDFGLSQEYKDKKTGLHLPYRNCKSMIGTVNYASLNSHNGIEQSRRDDLEALGYVFIHLLKGGLPWEKIKRKTQEELQSEVFKMKYEYNSHILCLGLDSNLQRYL